MIDRMNGPTQEDVDAQEIAVTLAQSHEIRDLEIREIRKQLAKLEKTADTLSVFALKAMKFASEVSESVRQVRILADEAKCGRAR